MTTPLQGTTPLPLTPPTATTAAPQRRRFGANAILTILVLTVAFLAASFPARNSDLWFHLATGRLLAEKQLTFGVDPFAYTTQGVYWVCHSWLFDRLLYGLYNGIGGVGLVVLKALLVTILAGLLLSIRRPGGSFWLPIVCTTLAVLAMSPRLLLQPACISYLFFGLTFWLLWRGQAGGRRGASIALLILFALWANVDEWFFLGPLLAALFWLGERLQGQRRTPGWIVPAGLAVCLLNPHTYHVFAVPAELAPVTWSSGLRQDVRFQGQFASPWQTENLQAAGKLNAAVLAYYVLTLGGLASFLFPRPVLFGWRAVVWLPFAAMAAWQTWAVPFFAVVAAPIMALNWQDFRAMEADKDSTVSLPPGLLVSLSTGMVLLALLCLTWLGWLAGYDREERHVAWNIQADPSLRRAAETLAQWQQAKLLPAEERVFAVAPQIAHYAAYFSPGVKQFFDHRYPLYPESARQYETVCRALVPDLAPETSPLAIPSEGDWREILKKHKIGMVVYYDRSPQRVYGVLRRLGDSTQPWTLLHVAGQALIVGWNKAPSHRALAFDADRLVFGPADERTQRQAPAAPERGPDRLPPRRDWRMRFLHPPEQPAWESTAAAVYLNYFNYGEGTQRERQYRSRMRAFAASLAALPAQPAGVPAAALQAWSARELLLPALIEERHLTRQDLGPFFAPLLNRSPSLPLLAVRAARRAVAADPADAGAWFSLGNAYLLLRDSTGERSGEAMLPPLAQLRHVQMVTALEQAVRLNPDLEAAHQALAFLYGERNYLDRSLEHRQEEIRLSRLAGPRPRETSAEFADRMEFLEKDTSKIIETVEDRRKKYAGVSASVQGDRRKQAEIALQLGLARQAIDEVLLLTPADVLGPAGIKLELDLMLAMGRAAEVRDILNDRALRASKHALGFYDLPPPRSPTGVSFYATPYRWPSYEWLQVLQAAAIGDYAQAREALRALRAGQAAEIEALRRQMADSERSAIRLLPDLLSGPQPIRPAAMLVLYHKGKSRFETAERSLRGQQADLAVLEGLLAVEQGEARTARAAFTEAMRLAADAPFIGRPIAVGYLGKLDAY